MSHLGSLSSSFLPGTDPEKRAASGLLCIVPSTTLPWYRSCVIISTWDKSCRPALWEPLVRQPFGINVRYVRWLCESTVNISWWNGTLPSTVCERLLCRYWMAAGLQTCGPGMGPPMKSRDSLTGWALGVRDRGNPRERAGNRVLYNKLIQPGALWVGFPSVILILH